MSPDGWHSYLMRKKFPHLQDFFRAQGNAGGTKTPSGARNYLCPDRRWSSNALA
jgi:hypothetical protein